MPAASPLAARTTGGSHIGHAGSCAWLIAGARPRKGPTPASSPASPRRMLASTISASSQGNQSSACASASYAPSLPTNPSVSGMPAIEIAAALPASAVRGIARRRPASVEMSRVPVSWSMAPATRNKAPL